MFRLGPLALLRKTTPGQVPALESILIRKTTQDYPQVTSQKEPVQDTTIHQVSELAALQSLSSSVAPQTYCQPLTTSLQEEQIDAALAGLHNCNRLDGRVLLLEPSSARTAQKLRDGGFHGEIYTLSQTTTLSAPPKTNHTPDIVGAPAIDHIVYADWSDFVRSLEYEFSNGSSKFIDHTSPLSDLSIAVQPEGFDLVITGQLLRHLSQTILFHAYSWIASLLQPHGYLVVAEPAPPMPLSTIEQALAPHGFQLVRDAPVLLDGWTYSVGLFQLRSQIKISRVGRLFPLNWNMLAASPQLCSSLVQTYQQIFGGPDWSEWARCARPGCGHHYSRADWEARAPSYFCDCGASPMVMFHTSDSILSHLFSDLTTHEQSCCYVHSALTATSLPDLHSCALPAEMTTPLCSQPTPTSVDSFLWGYITPAQDLLSHILDSGANCTQSQDTLSPSHADNTIKRILSRLQQWPTHHPSQSPPNPGISTTNIPIPTPTGSQLSTSNIFYVAELGVLLGLRSMSMARTLFQRALQFAADHNAQIMVGRTSRLSKAHRLLVGLGLEEIYSFASTQTPDEAVPAPSATAKVDPRVLLAGDVNVLLQTVSQLSDQRLVTHLAHSLSTSSASAQTIERSI